MRGWTIGYVFAGAEPKSDAMTYETILPYYVTVPIGQSLQYIGLYYILSCDLRTGGAYDIMNKVAS